MTDRTGVTAARPLTFLVLVLFLVVSCTASGDRGNQPDALPAPVRAVPSWLQETQVVSVWPLDHDQVRRFGIDVPGVFTWWDERKVRRLHEQGRVAVVNVEGLAAEPDLLAEHPELRAAVTKDRFGNEAVADWYQTLQGQPEPVVVLSILSPVFQRFLVGEGRRAVDIGADALYIDEIQTSALLISREKYAAGFGELELSAYDRHLAALGFDSPAEYLLSRQDADWMSPELESRLSSVDWARLSVPDLFRSLQRSFPAAQDALLEDYRTVQEDLAFRVMTQIIQRIREYASDQGSTLAIGANLSGMGGRTWWSPLMSNAWGPHLDFIVFENEVTRLGSYNRFIVSPTDGSFAPTYRLGRALTPGLVAAFPSVAYAPALHGQERYGTYLSIMYAEAFAFEGNWALGWWWEEMDWPRHALAPETLVNLTRFVTRYDDLYEGPRARNEIGVLYSNQSVLADPNRHESYYGLGQALAELNFQFDVVYAGDDRFGEVPISRRRLSGYETVLVPAANALTVQQAAVLRSFMDGGGEVIALEPVASTLEEGPGLRIIEDVGLAFRSGDAQEAIEQLDGILGGAGRIVLDAAGEGVLVTSYLRKELPGLVLHFVNRRYRQVDDRVEAASDVEVRIDQPATFDERWGLWVIAPGAPPQRIPFTMEPESIRFTLPRLDVYAVAVFSPTAPD